MSTSISGAVQVPAGVASSSYSTSTSKRIVQVDDPLMPNYYLYADEVTLTKTIVASGISSSAFNSSERNSPLGLKADIGCDFYSDNRFAVGLNLKLAAFWNMRSSSSALAGGGSVLTRSMKDYYLYENGPYSAEDDFSFFEPSTEPYAPYHQDLDDEFSQYPVQSVYARVRSDLYQIGLGPRVVWRTFDWLDFYADLEALCNIANLDFDCSTSNLSETFCRIGFGGNVGLTAYLTDNFGVYAEIGYEWVDKVDVSIGGANAEVDFSSLVISSGLVVSF